MVQIATSAVRGTEVLDAGRIASHRQRRPGFLERLVAAYLEEAPRNFASLEAGIAAGDLDAVRMAAHALKSSSANLGAMRLSEICQQIESAALSNDAGAVSALMATIGGELSAADQALKAIVLEQRQAAS